MTDRSPMTIRSLCACRLMIRARRVSRVEGALTQVARPSSRFARELIFKALLRRVGAIEVEIANGVRAPHAVPLCPAHSLFSAPEARMSSPPRQHPLERPPHRSRRGTQRTGARGLPFPALADSLQLGAEQQCGACPQCRGAPNRT